MSTNQRVEAYLVVPVSQSSDDARVFRCHRRGFLGSTYHLSSDSTRVGRIGFRGISRGEITVESVVHMATKDAPGVWTLTANHFVRASARRLDDDPLSIAISFDGDRWRIQANQRNLLDFDIVEGATVIGQIQSKIGFVSNRIEISAPASSPTLMLAFTAWLVGIHWVGIVGVAPRAFAKD